MVNMPDLRVKYDLINFPFIFEEGSKGLIYYEIVCAVAEKIFFFL